MPFEYRVLVYTEFSYGVGKTKGFLATWLLSQPRSTVKVILTSSHKRQNKDRGAPNKMGGEKVEIGQRRVRNSFVQENQTWSWGWPHTEQRQGWKAWDGWLGDPNDFLALPSVDLGRWHHFCDFVKGGETPKDIVWGAVNISPHPTYPMLMIRMGASSRQATSSDLHTLYATQQVFWKGLSNKLFV